MLSAVVRQRQSCQACCGKWPESQKDEGSWQEVGRLLEDINDMIKEHRLDPLPDDQASQRMAFSAYHQQAVAADEKRRTFDRCLKGFCTLCGRNRDPAADRLRGDL